MFIGNVRSGIGLKKKTKQNTLNNHGNHGYRINTEVFKKGIFFLNCSVAVAVANNNSNNIKYCICCLRVT